MSDEERVVVADRLWPHEAGMLKGVLEAEGIGAYVRGTLSTSGEIPSPVASVSVSSADEGAARVALNGIGSTAEVFFCSLCGEAAPKGFSECPVCTEPHTVDDPVESTRSGGLIFFGLLVFIFLIYGLLRVFPRLSS